LADIMAAARVVIAEKGYENILLSDIAQQAGVADGTLYRYFSNKRDLLIRVAEDWFEEQLAEHSELASVRDTRNRLRHLVWRALMVTRQQPALSRFLLTEIRPDPNFRSTRLFELNRRFTAEIRAVCKEAIENKEFRDDVSASLLRDMVFGCIEHRTWAFLRGEGDFSVDEVADGITNVIYRGMAAPPPAKEQDDVERIVKRLEKAAAIFEQQCVATQKPPELNR
jgi:TetR/AcrR family fatty acid metabolism transcriptional regulator